MKSNNEKMKEVSRAYPVYRLAIFDVDGTLVDSFPLFVKLLNQYAQKYQYHLLDEQRIEHLRDFPPRKIRRELGLSRLQAIRLAVDCKRGMQKTEDKPEVFSGIDTLLKDLKQQGYRLAIVTSNSVENCRVSLGEERLALFDWVQSNASIYGKQRQIKKVLRAAQCEPAHAIYIGDQITDIHSAQHLNMPIAAVTWGFNNASALAEAKPTYLCQSIDQLTRCLMTVPQPIEES